MVARFAAAVRAVADYVDRELAGQKPVPQRVPATNAQ